MTAFPGLTRNYARYAIGLSTGKMNRVWVHPAESQFSVQHLVLDGEWPVHAKTPSWRG